MIHDVPPEDRENDMQSALIFAREAGSRQPRADLLILPEIPCGYSCPVDAARDLPLLAKETGHAVMIPCTGMTTEVGRTFYNSVAFAGTSGSIGEEYRKIILAPFGEYIPLERQMPFLRRIFPGVMPYVPGEKIVTYDLGKGRRAIPSLCYEAIFTEHTRRFVHQGGNVLVNMVNDGWFGKSKASVVHLSLALYRTVEYRIPMVRVTNSGVGVFVQATGEIVPGSKTPLFEKAATTFPLYIPEARSPYFRWGDLFLYGLSLCFVAILARDLFRGADRGL
jgi:apolipoprotein N-acyltransferase